MDGDGVKYLVDIYYLHESALYNRTVGRIRKCGLICLTDWDCSKLVPGVKSEILQSA